MRCWRPLSKTLASEFESIFLKGKNQQSPAETTFQRPKGGGRNANLAEWIPHNGVRFRWTRERAFLSSTEGEKFDYFQLTV